MLGLIVSFVSTSPVIVSLVVLVVCLLLVWEYQRNYGLPPGPYGLPWFGYVFSMDKDRVSQQFAELCARCKTDILCVTILGRAFTVLNTYELTKEVFQKRSDVVDRSLLSATIDAIDPGYTGIIGNSGRAWREARRFSISTMKDFGMGRTGAEERIQNEARILCEMIKKDTEDAPNLITYMNIAVSNVICGFVFGERFDQTDPEFTTALNGMNGIARKFTVLFMFLMQFRFVRERILKGRFQDAVNDYNEFSRFVKKRIQEHRENLSYPDQGTDLIYSFLREMKDSRDPDIFNDRMLSSVITDLFIAGSETTYTTLRWCLLVMAAYPDIQKKVQSELDQVIGDRAASMNDKKHTPYSEAVLSEVQRHFTLVPLGLGHSNLESDINISGYRIPKGSLIMSNLNQIHHDKENWKNPDEFDPENFLEDGKVTNLDRLVPFAIGRRSCAGESLARMELYMFFTALVKQFEIKLVDDKPDLTGIQSTVYQPKPFKVRMIPRC